jgi:hypothetical protein
MPRNLCCCGRQPKPEAFCCNPIFYTDFITLYGDSMAQHAEVSPKDWIALYIERPGSGAGNAWTLSYLPSTSTDFRCNCTNQNGPCASNTSCECLSDNYYTVIEGLEGEALERAQNNGRRWCCQYQQLLTSTDGSKPIYFAYKYSGCNLIWYPREFAFNYDPYITQCNGFITRKESFNFLVQNSCHNWARQENRGQAGTQPSDCLDNFKIGYSSVLPCACSPHPHIHGGIYDSLYNRTNVKLSPYALGYLPFMLPFSQPMTIEEAGCCWCANTTGTDFEAFQKNRINCFAKNYPYSDGAGKTINISNVCGPGYDCTGAQNDIISYNGRYRRQCFERGISPYLIRLSKEDHKMAYEIWNHGATPTTTNDFGVAYNVRSIEIKNIQKDIQIKFKKFTGQKTRLRDQFIGTIHLEHHFEMYAYRSEEGSASIEIQALQNNCNSLVGDYEGYGGVISRRGSYYRWTPWKYDSIMWQVRRAVPRRVIYKGSGVPLYQFDLVNMESISFKKNIQYGGDYFEGTTFLEHYYRYFYGLIYFNEGSCEHPGDTPNAPEWDFSHYLNSYSYVRFWIEQMIENGIIKIKDHAIDISNEVNDIIASGNETPSGNLEVAEEVLLAVGGTDGYRNLINFFGVEAGTVNATTPKIIKEKLLNSDSLPTWRGPSGDYETFRAFLPRRAVLPISETKSGLTAWGYTGAFARLNDTNYGITGSPTKVSTAINDLPAIYDINDETSIYNEVLNPQRVICGLMGAFVIDASGKLTLFGYDMEDAPEGGCTDPFANWQPYVGCVPPYLLVNQLFQEDPENPGEIIERSPEDIPDGRVIDVAFKRDFAVALVDFTQGAIAQNCTIGPGNDIDFTPAVENSSNYDQDLGGSNANVNGNNEYFNINASRICSIDEPFNVGLANGTIPSGPRAALERRKANAYRLKSWGSNAKKYGTFCGSNNQGTENDFPPECTNEKIEYLRYNSEVNPILDGGFSRRYPGTNNFFIWTAVSSGVKHLAAIDDYGGLFITPQSDNTFNQSSKGLGVTYSSGYIQAIESGRDDFEAFRCAPGYHNGLGPKFNYYPHIPRPGFVKPEEWTQSFYNNITLRDSSYKQYLCQCWSGWPTCGQDPGFNETCTGPLYPLDPTDTLTGCSSHPYSPDVLDLTCVLMGSLVEYPDYTEPWTPRENNSQPRYIKISCGLYNTLCLTNENRLEIYGSYVKVTPEGEPIVDDNNPIIPAFVPDSLLSKAGTWDITYACPLHCLGATHSPIVDYSYNEPSANNVIEIIESSADYSICVTADKKIHVWGDASMVPGAFDSNTYQPGSVAYRVLDEAEISNATEIVAVAAGVNSFYIHYKKNIGYNSNGILLRASVTYEFTRYNINGISTEVPDDVQNSRIVDIGAGYLHAVAIFSKRLESKVWRAQDFAEDTLKYQFKNFSSLPFFFRRQAFFHALPGGWDYSKWLYGGVCCSKLENPGGGELNSDDGTKSGFGNPVSRIDPCAVLRYNIFNGNDDLELGYSGNPHLYWMRTDWRRSTFQSTEIVQVERGGFPDDPNVCRPDLGLSIDGSGTNFSFMSGVVGGCLNQYGPAWGTARPLKAQVRTFIRTPLGEECWRIPCTSFVTFVNPILNTDAPLTAIGVDPLPKSGYRATKDLFQKMTIFYGNRPNQNSNTLQTCPIARTSAWSYFKYSERHYYLGYDDVKDTWEIYENPDFLRETSQAPFVVDSIEQARSLGLDGCTLYGFGGSTGANGGGSAGCSGYYILYNYPLTGPNYGIENITETPVVLTDLSVQNLINLSLGDDPDANSPNEICDSCFSGFQRDQIERYLGPGGFMFLGARLLDNVNYNSDGEITGSKPLAPMSYSHLYNRTILRTQFAQNLLLGTETNLGVATKPPNAPDTDYQKKSFSEVLGDPELTQQYTPWRYASSTKWIPICWRTPMVVPNSNPNSLSNTELYFNFSVPAQDGNFRKQLSPVALTNIGINQSYPIYTLPVQGEDFTDFNQTIRLVEEFITDIGYPNMVSLQKGLFEFFIQCKSNYSNNPIYIFVKVFKISQDGTQSLIAESLQDVIINPTGSFETDTGTESDSVYKEIVTSCYFEDTIDMNISDRLLVKSIDSEIGDTIFIRYEDNTSVSGVSKYTRMQYTHVSEDINQSCFVGFDENDGPNTLPSTRFDPNIVILKYDENGIPIISGPPVICGILPCCGE